MNDTMDPLRRGLVVGALLSPVLGNNAVAAQSIGTSVNAILTLHAGSGTARDGSDDRAFMTSFAQLSNARISPAGARDWGLGAIRSTRGRFRFSVLAPKTSAIGFTWTGEGRFATSNEFNLTNGAALRLGPYVGVSIADMSFVNADGDRIRPEGQRGESKAILLEGAGGGTLLALRGVTLDGFRYGIFVGGAADENADTTLMEQVAFATDIGFTPGTHKQAIVNLMLNCVSDCSEALMRTAGGSETTILAHNGTVGEALIQFENGAGGETARTRIVDSKFEYHRPASARMLIDARAKTRPNEGGNAVYWRDSAMVGGLGRPADYDAHPIIAVSNDAFKLDFQGGYLRGSISYASSYVDPTTSCSFRYMEAAPVPERLRLTGTGTHPLIEWRSNGNVPVDQYRGGQAGIRSIDAQKALLWRPTVGGVPNRFLVMTGMGAHRDDFAGRKGADMTVTGLAPNTHVFGAAVFIENASPGDTLVQVFADAARHQPIAELRLPGDARGLHRLPMAERHLPDGRLHARVTRGGADEWAAGALVVFYFPYFADF